MENMMCWNRTIEVSVRVPTMCHPWGALTHTRKTPEMSQTHNGKGCKRHPALVPVDPCMVATNAGTLCNPFSTTRKQPASNPLHKIYTQDTKSATQMLPKWWQSARRVGIAIVTNLTYVNPGSCQHIQEMQSQRQWNYGFQSEWQWTHRLPSPMARVHLDTFSSSGRGCSCYCNQMYMRLGVGTPPKFYY